MHSQLRRAVVPNPAVQCCCCFDEVELIGGAVQCVSILLVAFWSLSGFFSFQEIPPAYTHVTFGQLTATSSHSLSTTNGAPTTHFKIHLPEIWVLVFFFHMLLSLTIHKTEGVLARTRTCSVLLLFFQRCDARKPMINKHTGFTLFLYFFTTRSPLLFPVFFY